MSPSPSTCPRCGAAVPNDLALAGGACAYCGGPIAGDPGAARALAAQAEAYRQIDEAVARARSGQLGWNWKGLKANFVLAVVFFTVLGGGRWVYDRWVKPVRDVTRWVTYGGQHPLNCRGDQVIEIDGKDVTVHESRWTSDEAAPAAINAYERCHVNLRASNVRAKILVRAQDDAVVTIVGGRLDCREGCVVAAGHAKVDIRDATIVARPGVTAAIEAGDDAQVAIHGGKIDGAGHAALFVWQRATASVEGADLLGDDALSAKDTTRVTVTKGSLQGSELSVRQDDDSMVTLEDVKLVGRTYVREPGHLAGN